MTVLIITLSMTALILLMLLFERIFGKKFSAKCRYILWTVILLRLAVPVTFPIFRVDVPKAEEHAPPVLWEDTVPMGDVAAYPVTSEDVSVILPDDLAAKYPDIDMTVSVEDMPEPDITVHRSFDLRGLWDKATAFLISDIARWIWLGGAVIFALVKLIAHGIYTAGLKRSLRLADRETYELFSKLKEKYRIANPPALYISDRVESPLLFGYFHPRILLPASVADKGFASSNAAVVILAHELTHCRRGDLWVKLLCLAAEAFHWFNPFVHLAARRCTQAMELSCDEAVLEGYDEDVRRSYGNVMLDIVKRCRNRGEALTTHFNPRKSAVTERFAGILDGSKKRKGIVLIALVLLICAVGCTVTMNRNTETDDTTSEQDTAGDLMEDAPRESLPYTFTEAERAEATKLYGDYLAGTRSMKEIIETSTAVRKDMTNRINENIAAIRKEETFTDLPAAALDLNDVPDLTEDQLILLYFETEEAAEKYGDCPHKFSIPLYGGDTEYKNAYFDLYFDIDDGGDSPAMVIRLGYIYDLWTKIFAKAPELLGDPNGVFHYNTRLPNYRSQFVAGCDKNGHLHMFYTQNNGDTFHPIDAVIPDMIYDTAEVIAVVRGGGSLELKLVVELTLGGNKDYVTFDNYDYTDDPLAFTYRGSIPVEEVYGILNTSESYAQSEAALDALRKKQKELEARLEGLESDRAALESELAYIQSEADVINLRNTYEMWLGGLLSVDSLLNGSDYVREDMANRVNDVLMDLRNGENPYERMPAPPTFEMPELPFDPFSVPLVTEERIPRIHHDAGVKSAENGNCGQKFTIAVPNGASTSQYYIDLYWGIGRFGESVEMYINHMEIYHIDERMTKTLEGIMLEDDTVGSLRYRRMNAWPYIEFWLFMGTGKDGRLLLYYTKDYGETVIPIDTTIPDRDYDKAVPVELWPREDRENTMVVVELAMGDEVEYIGFNHFRGDPYTFTYTGTLTAEEILAVKNYMPIANVSKNLIYAHQMHELDEVEACLPAADWDHRLDYIRAFLTNDVAALTEVCYAPDPAMYEDYAYISVTDWTVWLDTSQGEGNEMVYFSFFSPISPIDGFSEEERNTFIVQEGLYGIYLRSLTEEKEFTEESAKTVENFLNCMYFEAIPTSDEMPEHHRWCLTDYIIARLSEKTGKLFHTAEEIRDYAAFAYNIPDFTPSDTHRGDHYLEHPESKARYESFYENNLAEMEAGNLYTGVGHGGISHAFRITAVDEYEEKAYVQVQFYADIAMTVKSHRYEYVMAKKDGEWTILRSVLETPAKYDPFCVGT